MNEKPTVSKEELDGWYTPNTAFKVGDPLSFEMKGMIAVPNFMADAARKFFNSVPDEDVCPVCHGTGEVSTMEPVYPGEAHMADVGTRICECQDNGEDEYSDVDRDDEE